MANIRSGNVWYVDTAHSSSSDDLSTSLMVLGVVLTSSAAQGRIVLADAITGQNKLDVRVAAQNGNTNGDTQNFQFVTPLMFPNGIKVATLTTAVATLFVRDSGKADQ